MPIILGAPRSSGAYGRCRLRGRRWCPSGRVAVVAVGRRLASLSGETSGEDGCLEGIDEGAPSLTESSERPIQSESCTLVGGTNRPGRGATVKARHPLPGAGRTPGSGIQAARPVGHTRRGRGTRLAAAEGPWKSRTFRHGSSRDCLLQSRRASRRASGEGPGPVRESVRTPSAAVHHLDGSGPSPNWA